LTEHRDPICLQALAAAEAACGRYDDAWNKAKDALEVAALTKQESPSPQLEEQLQCYKSNKPYIARTPLRVLPFAPAPARTVFEWAESTKRD
jgi:hypothetical protein